MCRNARMMTSCYTLGLERRKNKSVDKKRALQYFPLPLSCFYSLKHFAIGFRARRNVRMMMLLIGLERRKKTQWIKKLLRASKNQKEKIGEIESDSKRQD